MAKSSLTPTVLALTFLMISSPVLSREDHEDPALEGLTLTQQTIDLIHAISDPAIREQTVPHLIEICPTLAISG